MRDRATAPTLAPDFDFPPNGFADPYAVFARLRQDQLASAYEPEYLQAPLLRGPKGLRPELEASPVERQRPA